jgi:hypothetical protein
MIESWRSKTDIDADCLSCGARWFGKSSYASARRHAEKTGHECHVEVHHVVVYKGTAAA